MEYKPLLMIPGPSDPYPEAVEEAFKVFYPHYGGEWLKLYTEVIEGLKRLFGTRDHVHIYPGPATAVAETALNSIIDKGDYVVHIGRGFFVDRFKQITEIYGGKVINIGSDRLGHRVGLKELEYLLSSIKPKAVFLVHSETSVGLLEDIESISALIPEKTFFIVDAVSIFGAIEYNADKWGIDLCIGYSSKALGALPGAVPFMVSDHLWEYVGSRDRYKGFMNDLMVWREYVNKWKSHPYPVSLPTTIIQSIKGALKRIDDEGIKNVEKRHYKVSALSREYIEELGFDPIPEENVESPTVSVFLLNRGLEANSIAKTILKEYGIMIATTWLIGLNGLRIGHMGYTADEELVTQTFKSLSQVVDKLLSE